MSTADPVAAAATSARRTLPLARDAAGDDDPAHWFATASALAPHRDVLAPPDDRFGRRVWAFAEALFSADGGPPPPARLAWLCADAADLVARAGPRGRLTFRLALWFVTWFAPLFALRLPPLGRASVPDRAAMLARFEHGALPQTGAILVLKAMLCVIWYEHPDAAREIGFDGRCLGAAAGASDDEGAQRASDERPIAAQEAP